MAIVRVPARIDYPYEGSPGYNVWNVRLVDDNPETWELGAALSALYDFYYACGTLYTTGTTITLGEGMVKDPLGSPEYVDDDRRTVTGSQVPGPSSTMLAIVCSWRTSSATRSGRGRTFIGPLSSNAAQGNGTPNDAHVTTLRNAATALVNASMGTGGWAIGVLSVKQGLLRDITGVTVKDRFSYLSSRRD